MFTDESHDATHERMRACVTAWPQSPGPREFAMKSSAVRIHPPSIYLSIATDSSSSDSILRICMFSERSTCLSPMSTTSPPMMEGFTCKQRESKRELVMQMEC